MQNSKPSIDLLVPGLLGPMSALSGLDATPSAPLVEKCLARSKVSQVDAKDYGSTLLSLFGVTTEQDTDLPTAPFCRLADGGQQDDGYWLQASPVHLRPDGDGLLLFDAGVLEISLDEANQLAEMFRKHFSDRGWQLEVHSPQRWYLYLEQKPDIQTIPLTDVIGRNVHGFLPQSGDSARWESILNEVQMLFYTATANMHREGRGLLAINGIWLHGGGSFHPVENAAYDSVSGDEALVRGLAMAAGIEPVALPQDSSELAPDSGKRLVVANLLERPVLDADPYGWVESLEKFDAWLQPLIAEVSAKRLGYINLYPCNGSVYRVDAGAFRRFWRLRKPLSHHLS